MSYGASDLDAFEISTADIDDEIARRRGPQLVVPLLSTRAAARLRRLREAA